MKRDKSMMQANLPPDLARRTQIARQVRAEAHEPAPPGHGPLPPENPALRALPPAARRLAEQPATRLQQSAKTIVEAHFLLDAPELADDQRKGLNIPQAASAPFVARAQVRALGTLPQHLAQLFPVAPTWINEQTNRYGEAINIAPGLVTYLSGTAIARLAVRAARRAAEAEVDRFIEKRLAELKPTDPEYSELEARYAQIRQLRAKAAERQAQQQDQAQAHHGKVLEALSQIESEHQLADVWQQLRNGQVPDHATLIIAARYLRELQDQTVDKPPPATAPQGKSSDTRARTR